MEKWVCQNCKKKFEATDKFGRVESYFGFLCHACIKKLQEEGEELRFEDVIKEAKHG